MEQSKYGLGIQNSINRIVNTLVSNMDVFNTFKMYAFMLDAKEFGYQLYKYCYERDGIDCIGVDFNIFKTALQSKNAEDSLYELKA